MSNEADIRKITIEWTRAQPLVRRFVRGFILDQAEADDVLQEVALVVVDRFDHYDPDRNFAAWSLGIARRVVWNHLRKRYRESENLLMLALENVSDAVEKTDSDAEEAKDALAACLKKVGSSETRILKLRYEQGLKVKQIASEIGRSSNSVGVMLHRIRFGLKKCIQRRLGGEGT